MANEVSISNPTGTYTQLLFADHATDFGAAPATAANSLIIGTPTDVQIDLTGLTDTSGRQSAKTGDLGDPRASLYRVDACIEWESAPTDNAGTVDFYWAGSPSATAGTGNAGGVSGSDASFTHTAGIRSQLKYIGSLTIRNNVINIGFVGFLQPEHRYGSLIVINNSGGALRSTATAMDETHITLTPAIYEPAA